MESDIRLNPQVHPWTCPSFFIMEGKTFYAKNGLLHAFEVNEKCALCTNVLLK